jgi:hypothetical protein
MSTTTSNATREPAARPTGTASRLRHTPGGAGLGKHAGHEAQRVAAAILEVLAGVRTPSQAAEALGVSQARYFQVETRAVQALVASCEPRPRGPGRNTDRELTALRREHERLQRELSRQQTLVRLAQRTIGLPAPKAPGDKPGGKDKSTKRRRRPVVRALRAAEALQRRSQEGQSQEGRSQEAQSQEAASAAATPELHEED